MAINTEHGNKNPIFIHSLFRAGSTFLFNVFRRSERGYWCYQEPLHELAALCRENPSGLLEDHGEEKTQLLRHPKVDDSYFRELMETWPAWKDAINEQIIYDAYFAGQDEDIGVAYWHALAEAARGRPVFQECRTSGRIGAIKSQMKVKGRHIYLWRNPWDQWWSYKVTPYFDVANQLIIHARSAPQPVRRLLSTLDLPAYKGDDITGAMTFYGARPLSSEHRYFVFYLLWCLALREGIRHADLMLNIDRLSDSAAYQTEMQARLKEAGIDSVDFSDCCVPQGRYPEKDQAFFGALESQVHQWLIEGGWTQQHINQIHALRQQYQPMSWNAPIENISPADMAEQSSRARMLVCRLETSSARAEIRAIEAEARAAEQEQRATHAAAHVQQVNARAQLAETQAQQADARAQLAETQAQQADARAQLAETQAQQADARAQLAETQAQQADARAQLAETQAQQAEDIQRSTQQELANLHQANHHHWKLAEERDHQIKALLNSVSWKITAPMRIVGSALIRLRGWRVKSPSPPRNISMVTIRNAAVTPVIAIARYMQNSPYFRNIALRGLSYTPGLAIKLRRMYIESELKYNSFKDEGIGDLGAPSAEHSFSSHIPNPTGAGGINSCQRSPLETYFHRYGKYR